MTLAGLQKNDEEQCLHGQPSEWRKQASQAK